MTQAPESTSAYTAGLIDLDFTGGGPIGIRVGCTVMDDEDRRIVMIRQHVQEDSCFSLLKGCWLARLHLRSLLRWFTPQGGCTKAGRGATCDSMKTFPVGSCLGPCWIQISSHGEPQLLGHNMPAIILLDTLPLSLDWACFCGNAKSSPDSLAGHCWRSWTTNQLFTSISYLYLFRQHSWHEQLLMVISASMLSC